jgi:excisionase family DNA binding protein
MDEWISVKEASEKLNVSTRTVTNWIHQRKLKAKRGEDGREWLVHSCLSAPEEDWVQDASEKYSDASEYFCENDENFSEHASEFLEMELDMRKKEIKMLEQTNGLLQHQLDERDKQIHELHQLLGMAQTNLQREQIALEDFRQRSLPWWRRLFKKNKPHKSTAVMMSTHSVTESSD